MTGGLVRRKIGMLKAAVSCSTLPSRTGRAGAEAKKRLLKFSFCWYDLDPHAGS
jgi:hypothetical protein